MRTMKNTDQFLEENYRMSKFRRAVQILREEGLSQLVGAIIIEMAEKALEVRCVDDFCFEKSKRSLLAFMSSEKNLCDISGTAFNYCGMGPYKSIRPLQIPSEIEILTEKVKEISPLQLVEIGTAEGGSLYIFSRYLESCQRIISIDLPKRDSLMKEKFFGLFGDNNKYFLYGDSHSEKIVNSLSRILKSDKIDFLFIDGDHSYEGVKRDFSVYKKFVSNGGIIALHDIANTHPFVSG